VPIDVAQAIRQRRSTRSFQQKELPKELLLQIVEAGIWAPNGGNAQTWVFVVVTEGDRLRHIRAVSPGILGTPAAVVAICQDKELAEEKGGRLARETASVMDSAMAGENIMLYAVGAGVGSCAVLSFHKEAVRQLLGLPQAIVPELLITLGYAAEENPLPRREFQSVCFFEKYGIAHGSRAE